MAKRTNIIRILNAEVIKGNNFITKNGNVVSVAMTENYIKEAFIRDLRNDVIPMTYNYEDYKASYMENYIPVDAVLKVLNDLGITSEPKEAAPDSTEEAAPDTPKPKNRKPTVNLKGGEKTHANK